ncbi:Toll-like receptor 6 [Gryllus bimaculatus]|nr:Toll-like receptor 6 [Gryllus bimaculatus]
MSGSSSPAVSSALLRSLQVAERIPTIMRLHASLRSGNNTLVLLCVWFLFSLPSACYGQCPWARDLKELQSSCICAYNLGHELSVQCDMVDYSLLLNALDRYARATPIDLLYINNSTIAKLEAGSLERVKIQNLQMSGCRIRGVQAGAFRGQEASLKNLNLQNNELGEVPVEALRPLARLALLDLSRNRLRRVPDEAFASLASLTTLKLSDNNLTLAPGAFRGLERSLKNLNLKGTGQKRVPDAVRGLKTLAFLDMSQNALQELGGGADGEADGVLAGLDSLAALNLERNLIDRVADDAFLGVTDTLSSLSLLNNLLAVFPARAINSLRELRVLDVGYNLLAELPEDAFAGTPSLTLLALDGNLLETVPARALRHLNATLRGLSLGSAHLRCDCRLRWVAEWIRHGDLQVTSRERNPQFCGAPAHLRERSFYSIRPDELKCVKDEDEAEDALQPGPTHEIALEDDDDFEPVKPAPEITLPQPPSPTTPRTTPSTTPTRRRVAGRGAGGLAGARPARAVAFGGRGRRRGAPTGPRPPLVLAHPHAHGARLQAAIVQADAAGVGAGAGAGAAEREVVVRSAHRQDNSVVIQWDSFTSNILGFRVVYRLFGDATFKQGPPLEASEREFRIKNVPPQECIVVCVISLEDVNITPQTVPYAQCREVRTVAAPGSNMDKITIAASAAICGTVVIAVVVFVAASRRRSRKLHTLQQHPHAGVGVGVGGGAMTLAPSKGGGGLARWRLGTAGPRGARAWPACCAARRPHPQPRRPALLARHARRLHPAQGLGPGVGVQQPQHPAPARLPHGATGFTYLLVFTFRSMNAGCSIDHQDGGSHFGASLNGAKAVKTRSIADGQSQHSFSNHSGRYTGPYSSGLVNTRPEIRQSRQSLAAVSDHLSRVSYTASHQAHPHAHQAAAAAAAAAHQGASRRQRSRSRSRDHGGGGGGGGGPRPSSRYSTAGSTNTLNYLEPTDWTDHDMDIYMARNTTTRGGLVPL